MPRFEAVSTTHEEERSGLLRRSDDSRGSRGMARRRSGSVPLPAQATPTTGAALARLLASDQPNKFIVRALDHDVILRTQQTLGNRQVQRLLALRQMPDSQKRLIRAEVGAPEQIQRAWSGGEDETASEDGGTMDWVSEPSTGVDDGAAETSDAGAGWASGEASPEGAKWTSGGTATPESDETENAQDEAAAAFRPPWIEEHKFAPGMSPAYLNYEGGRQDMDTGWTRDPVATGAMSAVAGLAGSVAALYIPVSALVRFFIGSLGSAASAYWRSYKGYQVQRRVSGALVSVHEWYGRYRRNIFDGTIEAVDFAGRGPTMQRFTTIYLEHRLTDAEGNVLYVHPPGATLHGFDLENSSNLPEYSFGDVAVWDTDW